jgi:SAM-dependent methyltransferase
MDALNRKTMQDPAVVAGYARGDALEPAERALLERVAAELRGAAILDLGVGGGRTVPALRVLAGPAGRYVGLELEPAMAAACRRRFPDAAIEVGDARDLSRFADGSFGLVVFSCNGLGMVGHADRLRVLAEVRRVLAPGGAFLFSTHNRRSPDHDAGFQLPVLELSANPLRLGVRALRFARDTARRLQNRRRHRPREERHADYSIINDVCHHYGTMLYYVDLPTQRRQLVAAGFAPDAAAVDLAGREITGDCRDSSITLLARRA